MEIRDFIRTYKVNVVIVLYIIVFFLAYKSKANIFYNADGSLKQLGVGYKNKTILPLWLFGMFAAIILYLLVSYITL